MRIFHPQMTLHGAERDNSFVVQDLAGVELGQGWLRATSARERMPERPLHITFQMDAHPRARDMLYGALIARAMCLCRQRADIPARVMTECHPNDVEMLAFFEEAGFDLDDGEELFRWTLTSRDRPFYQPMSMTLDYAPLHTAAEWRALLQRIAQYAGEHEPEWLQEAAELPYFMVLGVYTTEKCVGEILVTGNEGEAVLEMLYVLPAWRRHHVATALLLRAQEELLARGAQTLRVQARRSNAAALDMLQAHGFQWLHTVKVYPGMNL